jgi:Helix-turn-helix domain
MSIRLMSQVWEDVRIRSQAELLVLLALADHARDDGLCWPSMRTIAAKARIEERSAQRILRRLSDAKLNATGREECTRVEPKGTSMLEFLSICCQWFAFAFLKPLTSMSIMLKVQAILQDGSTAFEFMTEMVTAKR